MKALLHAVSLMHNNGGTKYFHRFIDRASGEITLSTKSRSEQEQWTTKSIVVEHYAPCVACVVFLIPS